MAVFPLVVHDRPIISPTYKSCWNKFRNYVEDQEYTAPEGAIGQYVTRVNVDGFFTEVIPTMNIQPDTAARYRTSLQWVANKWEWGLNTEMEPKSYVNNGVVQQALNQHATNYLLAYNSRNNDAHSGLPTGVLTDPDHNQALKWCFTHMSDNSQPWMDFSLSWTGCHATFARQDTLRKLNLNHLRADKAHSPAGSSPNNQTILSLVLEPGSRKDDSAENPANTNKAKKGGAKKKKKEKSPTNYKKRVVGAYRHRSVLQCFTGQVAISLVYRFSNEETLSFIQPGDKKERPEWKKKKLLPSWGANDSGRKACEKSYKEVMGACGIEWNKVTHLRSAAMEKASSSGLNADQLATMSKHRGERLFDAYLTELFPEVMLVMSGHRPKDTWFVPRTEVENLPFSLHKCIRVLFPNYDAWLEEFNGPTGTEHSDAQNFLYELIPFLTRVVFQDAPYWFKFFPNHAWSCFLRSLPKLPVHQFQTWCDWAITEAQSIADMRAIDEVQTLNNAARYVLFVVFLMLQSHITGKLNKHRLAFDMMVRKNSELASLSEQQKKLIEQLEEKIGSLEKTIGEIPGKIGDSVADGMTTALSNIAYLGLQVVNKNKKTSTTTPTPTTKTMVLIRIVMPPPRKKKLDRSTMTMRALLWWMG